MIDVGSRDENTKNNGVAHFIEHTVFKGTDKRKAHHILRRIENVGGELNAYTTREKTSYYASCLKKYAARAVDLLTDISFHSVFPEKELQKEKKVILEEIDMYEDSAEESIYDDFYALLFKNHSLGYNILGTKDTVSNLTRESIQDFIKTHYVADHIVLSIVGDLTPSQAERLGNKFVSQIPLKKSGTPPRIAPPESVTFTEKYIKDFAQSHCIIGTRAYPRYEEKRYTLSLINNILGNAGMSARLNMAVREKHGLVYSISSHYSNYKDSGVFTIYFGSDAKNLARCQEIIRRELKKMRENRFSTQQLHQAKVQLLGQIAMLVENNSMHMQHQARSLLDYGYVADFNEYTAHVEKITSSDILEVSNEILNPDLLCTLVYEDEKE
jgi:predicted Zn-dependent peptidase